MTIHVEVLLLFIMLTRTALVVGAVIKSGGYFTTLGYLLPFHLADMTCEGFCHGITFAIDACKRKKVSPPFLTNPTQNLAAAFLEVNLGICQSVSEDKISTFERRADMARG